MGLFGPPPEVSIVLRTRCGCTRTMKIPKKVPQLTLPLTPKNYTPGWEGTRAVPTEPLVTSRTFAYVGDQQTFFGSFAVYEEL